ncbi:MAG: nitrous oxide reductase family maturation protein NosD [Promethearchaeota archaeon]
MPDRNKVSRCVLSVTLFMFLMALAVSVTPVADLDGIAHQSTTSVSDTKRGGIFAAGTPHGPIAIDGDANFSDTALLEGWPGDGSPEDPFIIDGLEIDLGGGEGDCISISNTQVSFTISNCNLTGGWGGWGMGYWGAGVYLNNVTNCELVKNSCTSNIWGIFLRESDTNTVANNICNNNERAGILLSISNYSTMVYNTCNDNQDGIILSLCSESNTVANNICNTNNVTGIYLVYSDGNTVVNNLCFSNNDYGIYLFDSLSNTVVNNICNSNDIGIYLDFSESNTVSENTCSNNRIGIYLFQSDSNIVDNTCLNNREHAILEGDITTESGPFDPVVSHPVEFLLLVGVVGIIMLGAGWRMVKLSRAGIS